MWYVNGIPVLSGDIHWQYSKGGAWDEEEGVKVSFHLTSFSNQYQRRQAIKAIERILEKNNVSWITTGHKEWTLDLDKLLDKLKEFIPGFSSMNWFKGKVSLEPEFETEERIVFDKPKYDARVAFYIVPEVLRRPVMPLEPPIEIKESFERFKHDYPDPTKVAFIIMQFGKTKAHNEIVKAIRRVLNSHDISGVKADDKQYHDDLFPNVMTYLYGCGFGIAVFERIEAEKFNPNVSLEVGYMLALKKSVCLLKDGTLETLHTDLVGKLYKAFNTQDPIKTIPDKITQWLFDKGII
jgi:nucleoside 2-deoxyribosyltransferase